MEQADFRGEHGAYHPECHGLRADIHLINWNGREDGRDPMHCPYCGSEDIWSADEAVRDSGPAV